MVSNSPAFLQIHYRVHSFFSNALWLPRWFCPLLKLRVQMNLFTACQVHFWRKIDLGQKWRVSTVQWEKRDRVGISLIKSVSFCAGLGFNWRSCRTPGASLRRGTACFSLARADVRTLSFPRCRGGRRRALNPGVLPVLDAEPHRLDLGLPSSVLFV